MSGSNSQSRRGAITVEFAMTAPLLFIMLFGALELGHAKMVFKVTEAAAYEGARNGIVPGASVQEVHNGVNTILASSNIRDAAIIVTPSNLNQTTEFINVRVSVPYGSNTLMPPFFTGGMVVERNCRLTRENPN